MDLDRLKDLIKKYRENMKYYHDTKNAYNETECRDEYKSIVGVLWVGCTKCTRKITSI